MAEESNAFEPFYDYNKISDDRVAELHEIVSRRRNNVNNFVLDGTRDTAVEFLAGEGEWIDFIDSLLEEVFTVPVMVHEAGPKKVEEHPDDPDAEITVQRCTRCASPVQMWQDGMLGMTDSGPRAIEEEEIPWWKEGDIIAKATSPGGIGMYEIDPKRELESHEKPCVGLPNL